MKHLISLLAAALMTSPAALAEGNPPTGSVGGGFGNTGPGTTTTPPPTNAPSAGTPAYGKPAPTAVTRADASPIVIVVPAFFATDPNLANGCWARLYDKRDFKGTLLTLVGPVDIPNNSPGYITGFEPGRNFDSVQVGSRATLSVWEKPKYEGNKTATVAAGQALPNLNDRLGDMKEIRSMRVSCTP